MLPEQWDESARQACLRPDGSWRFGNMHQQLRLLWGMYARCYTSDYRPNLATARRWGRHCVWGVQRPAS